MKKTCQIRYGSNSFLQSDNYKYKIKNKYNVSNYSETNIPKKSRQKLNSKQWLHNQYKELNRTSEEIAELLQVSDSTVLRKLYQDSHLAGDINNKSTENMIHNYLSEDEDK